MGPHRFDHRQKNGSVAMTIGCEGNRCDRGFFGCRFVYWEVLELPLMIAFWFKAKPHGQLVPVSLTHRCAYTSGLSPGGLPGPFRQLMLWEISSREGLRA